MRKHDERRFWNKQGAFEVLIQDSEGVMYYPGASEVQAAVVVRGGEEVVMEVKHSDREISLIATERSLSADYLTDERSSRL